MLSDFGVCALWVFSQNWSTPFHRWFFSWDQTRTWIIFRTPPLWKNSHIQSESWFIQVKLIRKVYLGKIVDEPVDREDAQKIDMSQTLRTGKATSRFSDLHHDNLWEPKLIVSVRFFFNPTPDDWKHNIWTAVKSWWMSTFFFKNKQCTCFQLALRWSFDLCIRNYRARRIRFLGHAHGVGWHWIVIYIPRRLSFPSTSLGCE